VRHGHRTAVRGATIISSRERGDFFCYSSVVVVLLFIVLLSLMPRASPLITPTRMMTATPLPAAAAQCQTSPFASCVSSHNAWGIMCTPAGAPVCILLVQSEWLPLSQIRPQSWRRSGCRLFELQLSTHKQIIADFHWVPEIRLTPVDDSLLTCISFQVIHSVILRATESIFHPLRECSHSCDTKSVSRQQPGPFFFFHMCPCSACYVSLEFLLSRFL
jgi:hypothetical protein